MTNKTRKYAWPASAMMAVALVAALAAFIALAGSSGVSEAHNPDTNVANHCDDQASTIAHDIASEIQGLQNADGSDHDCDNPGTEAPPPIDPTPTMPMPQASDHATMPTSYDLEGLDNSARLNWEKPASTGNGATVIGYRIDRNAWNPDEDHPINMHGDDTFNLFPENILATEYTDRGLAYETVYIYMVAAIVEYDVEHWWNNLNCMQMNAVVMPGSGEPQVGPNTPGTAPYCVMYDDLSDAAKTVVQRAYDSLEGKYPDAKSYYRYAVGEWSRERAVTTATSGGLLDALVAPPSPPRNVMTTSSCADQILVTWMAPSESGKVPANFPGCATCTNQTPPHVGGDQAGIVVQPGTAIITGYTVERKVGNGAWEVVATDVTVMSYADTDGLEFGETYSYRVTAMNNVPLSSDPSDPSAETLTTPMAPQVPTSPDADTHPDDPSKVQFTWDPPGTAAGTATWRTESDVGAANKSRAMSYIVERQKQNPDGTTGEWVRLVSDQKHQYLPSAATAAEAIANIQTQVYDDDPPAGAYKYRVSAQIETCAQSEWVVTAQEVSVGLGDADNLSVTAAPVPGVVNLSWTPGANANIHWVAGIARSASGAYDYTKTYWSQASSNSSHMASGLSSGTEYVFTVIAGQRVGTSENWGNWTPTRSVTVN